MRPAVTFVAAMTDPGRVIGKDRTLPWSLPADLAHFRRVTVGKPVVMGRRVYEDLGRPLPGRQNIVLSRDPAFSAEGCVVVPTPLAALEAAGQAAEVMVIGGAQVYRAYLEEVTCLYLTRIYAPYPGDTFFPDLPGTWEEISRADRPADVLNPADMSFVTYLRLE